MDHLLNCLLLIFGFCFLLQGPVKPGDPTQDDLVLSPVLQKELQVFFSASSPQQQWERAHGYLWGAERQVKDQALAASWFHAITQAGLDHPFYARSQYRLGWMYLYGIGLPLDPAKAAGKFRIAAEELYPQAMCELGWLYLEGLGVNLDKTAALAWFQKAASQGSSHAAWLLTQLSTSPRELLQSRGKELREPLTNMSLLKVEPGTFQRQVHLPPQTGGDSPPAHQVTISRAFYLGKFEVTRRQWLRVMGTVPPYFGDLGEDLPVVGVNWFQVQAFIRRLNLLSPMAGFRLPTEAEWEYVCRAGSPSKFHWGDALSPSQANIDFRYANPPHDQFTGHPTPVGHFPANAWGFHDMHGNVLEWCQDDWCALDLKRSRDPRGICDSGQKVIRGGSWFFGSHVAQSGYRDLHRPQDLGKSLGFRLVKGIPHSPKP